MVTKPGFRRSSAHTHTRSLRHTLKSDSTHATPTLLAAVLACLCFPQAVDAATAVPWLVPTRTCGEVLLRWYNTDAPGGPASVTEKWILKWGNWDFVTDDPFPIDGTHTLAFTHSNCTSYNAAGGYKSPCIFTSRLSGLAAGSPYSYKLWPGDGKDPDPDSRGIAFYAPACHASTPPSCPVRSSDAKARLLLFGDLGATQDSKQTLDALQKQELRDAIVKDDRSPKCAVPVPSAALLLGDASYADGTPEIWDEFAQLTSGLFSRFPVYEMPGNHEWEASDDEYNAYTARYGDANQKLMTVPANGRPECAMLPATTATSEYYSFDVAADAASGAGIHTLVLNPYDKDFLTGTGQQYAFMRHDLECINRTVTPWVVVALHAPLYHSNVIHQNLSTKLRPMLEPIFWNASVDVVVGGHVHALEITEPLACNRTEIGGPTYVVSGAAGNPEGLYNGWMAEPLWSRYRNAMLHGFVKLETLNKSTAVLSVLAGQDRQEVHRTYLASTFAAGNRSTYCGHSLASAQPVPSDTPATADSGTPPPSSSSASAPPSASPSQAASASKSVSISRSPTPTLPRTTTSDSPSPSWSALASASSTPSNSSTPSPSATSSRSVTVSATSSATAKSSRSETASASFSATKTSTGSSSASSSASRSSTASYAPRSASAAASGSPSSSASSAALPATPSATASSSALAPGDAGARGGVDTPSWFSQVPIIAGTVVITLIAVYAVQYYRSRRRGVGGAVIDRYQAVRSRGHDRSDDGSGDAPSALAGIDDDIDEDVAADVEAAVQHMRGTSRAATATAATSPALRAGNASERGGSRVDLSHARPAPSIGESPASTAARPQQRSEQASPPKPATRAEPATAAASAPQPAPTSADGWDFPEDDFDWDTALAGTTLRATSTTKPKPDTRDEKRSSHAGTGASRASTGRSATRGAASGTPARDSKPASTSAKSAAAPRRTPSVADDDDLDLF